MNSELRTVNSESNQTFIPGEYFDFEKLKAYQAALDLVDAAFDICTGLPANLQYSIGDQYRRAALSVTNNIAEGSGKESDKERRRYYSIAMDSARECASMCVVLHRRSVIATTRYMKLRTQIREITNMLVGLMDALL